MLYSSYYVAEIAAHPELTAVAICFLHAYRFPEHEHRLTLDVPADVGVPLITPVVVFKLIFVDTVPAG